MIPSTIEFFNLIDNKNGFYHAPHPLDDMLYIIGRSHKIDHIWNVWVKMKRKYQFLISLRTILVFLGRVAKICLMLC